MLRRLATLPPLIIFSASCSRNEHRRFSMLWTIFVVLVILWLLGFSLQVVGGLIYLLLVAAVAVLIYNLVSGRRSAV